MVEIKLQSEKLFEPNGYDVVSEQIQKFWESHPQNNVLVFLEISYDGIEYKKETAIAYPDPYAPEVEFLDDWWEGQEYIRITGIFDVDDAREIIQKKHPRITSGGVLHLISDTLRITESYILG